MYTGEDEASVRDVTSDDSDEEMYTGEDEASVCDVTSDDSDEEMYTGADDTSEDEIVHGNSAVGLPTLTSAVLILFCLCKPHLRTPFY